jgi:hypothetical protein
MTNPSATGCCSQVVTPTTVPLVISNPPGLTAIRYRIGTFTSFRQAMLDSIALPDLMATSVTTLKNAIGPSDPKDTVTAKISVLDFNGFPAASNFQIKIGSEYLQVIDGTGTATWTVVRGPNAPAHSPGDIITLSPPNPFASWQAGTANDYQTMFVELWAYLADILTFYQERIANEACLGTASLRDSLLRLVELIDYQPGPGAGASGLVAFTAANGTSLTVPAGFRVGSKPAPGQSAVVFETSAAATVVGENSSIALSSLSPDVAFQPQTVVLQGINNSVAVNDYVLVVENEGTNAEASHLIPVSTVTVDKATNTTTITWISERGVENGDEFYAQASKQASVYAFRVSAAPFGANAPAWNTLSPTLNGLNPPTGINVDNAPFKGTNWDSPVIPEKFIDIFPDTPITIPQNTQVTIPSVTVVTIPQNTPVIFSQNITVKAVATVTAAPDGFQQNDWYYAPVPGDPPTVLFLDAVYKQLNYTGENPGWAVLLTGGANGVFQQFHVIDARQGTKVAYSLSSKVTRLTFHDHEQIPKDIYPIRDTVVLTGNELLPLQIDLPLPVSLSGDQLILQGVQNQLQSGQTIVVKGTIFDPRGNTSVEGAESGLVDGPPVPDAINNITRVKLKTPLTNTYVRATCVVMGNIVEVTQGETVKDEVLGSSDGSAFQSYPLKKEPLTYLPSTDPEGLSAVKSTLNVIVNGVAWNEQPNLAESTPDAQDFTTTLDDTGQTTVVFGDGFNGAKPPSGTNNIHARYRKGLGSAGNLASDSIQQLVDGIPNLKKVTNPVPSSGGSDPDSPAQIRTTAPSSVRTFSRAVSAPDYAALARSFPGISKATATWVVNDPVTGSAVAHPYVQLTVATVDETPIQGTLLASNLRRFLDNHRDPNVPLRFQDFSPVYIELIVEVEIDGHFPQNGTLAKVQAALNPSENPDGTFGYFAFQNLQFGQPIFLSAIYATVQNIPGITDATITSLRRVGPGMADPPSTAPHDIIVGPTEIAIIGAPGADQGQLEVTGSGGFIDT